MGCNKPQKDNHVVGEEVTADGHGGGGGRRILKARYFGDHLYHKNITIILLI